MKPILARLKQLGEAIGRVEAQRVGSGGRVQYVAGADELKAWLAKRAQSPEPKQQPETPAAKAPQVNPGGPGKPVTVSEPVSRVREPVRESGKVIQFPREASRQEPDAAVWFKPGRDDRFDDPMHFVRDDD